MPDVLHGKPRTEGTRIGVFQVDELVRERGTSIEVGEITDQYPPDREQVAAAVDDGHPEVLETLQHSGKRTCTPSATRAGRRSTMRPRGPYFHD